MTWESFPMLPDPQGSLWSPDIMERTVEAVTCQLAHLGELEIDLSETKALAFRAQRLERKDLLGMIVPLREELGARIDRISRCLGDLAAMLSVDLLLRSHSKIDAESGLCFLDLMSEFVHETLVWSSSPLTRTAPHGGRLRDEPCKAPDVALRVPFIEHEGDLDVEPIRTPDERIVGLQAFVRVAEQERFDRQALLNLVTTIEGAAFVLGDGIPPLMSKHHASRLVSMLRFHHRLPRTSEDNLPAGAGGADKWS